MFRSLEVYPRTAARPVVAESDKTKKQTNGHEVAGRTVYVIICEMPDTG